MPVTEMVTGLDLVAEPQAGQYDAVILAVAHRHHRHARLLRQHRVEHAFVRAVQVRDDHVGHAGFLGQRFEQLRDRCQSAGRCADAGDGDRR